MKYLLALVLALAACAIPAPKLDVMFPEPEQFKAMYSDLEKCSGIQGDYGGIAWYTTTSNYHRGNHFDAYWQPGGIVVNQKKLADRELVLHEMMHDILKTAAHPKEYFHGRCGDLSLGEVL